MSNRLLSKFYNAKKRASEIVYAITGVDTPFFGISWNPPANEVEVAQRFITFIENKRVLYRIYEDEVATLAIASVNDIRQEIGNNLKILKRASKLAKHFIELQEVCREFLNAAEPISARAREFHNRSWEYDTGDLYASGFFSALGTFREQFCNHASKVVVIYDLSVSEHLKPFLTEQAIGEITVKGYVHVYTYQRNLEPTIILKQNSDNVLSGKIWVLECPPHLLRILYSYDKHETTIQGISIKDGQHIRVQLIKPPEESMPSFQKVEQILIRRIEIKKEIGEE